MPIEVLERGTPAADKVYEATCRGCHSRLKFKRGDAELKWYPGDEYLQIECPVCKRGVYVQP